MSTPHTPLNLLTGTSTLPGDRVPALAAGPPEQPMLAPSSVAVAEFEPLGRAPTQLLGLAPPGYAVPSFATDASAIDRPTASICQRAPPPYRAIGRRLLQRGFLSSQTLARPR